MSGASVWWVSGEMGGLEWVIGISEQEWVDWKWVGKIGWIGIGGQEWVDWNA